MRKLLVAAGVALLVFFVLDQPKEAADLANQGTTKAQEGADGAVSFVSALSGGTIAFLLILGVAWLLTRGK